MSDPNQRCNITFDRTDFRIQEPIPFNPKWYSHKFKGPGLRYEVAICIKTGWIVWVNGPFPAGEWPDRKIAQAGINHHLDENECYVGDGGYYDGRQWAETPTGYNNHEQKMYAMARACHETVNRRFKQFGCNNNNNNRHNNETTMQQQQQQTQQQTQQRNNNNNNRHNNETTTTTTFFGNHQNNATTNHEKSLTTTTTETTQRRNNNNQP